MLGRLIKLGVLAGAGYAAWKTLSKQQGLQKQPFFQQALQSGVADVAAARSAQLRGASADVRAFAQQLEHDHGEHNLELAQAAGLELPEADARQKAALRTIDQLQGEAYDQAWLKHMARCHRDAIRLYERELAQSGAGGPLAEELLPKLRSHADRIAALQSGAGAETATPAADTRAAGANDDAAAGFGEPRAVM